MFVEQFYLGCLSQASYVIGDEASRTAIVVDPRRDIDAYLDFCGERDLEIKHIVLTHFHADFAAGHLELQKATGAPVHLGKAADAAYAFEPLADGDILEYGDMRIEVWETPGHTPEMVNLVVYDTSVDGWEERPYGVLTGDTLFNGDVGRPDLLVSVGMSQDELARMLYRSVQRLMSLPDDAKVFPGHGAGSACGKSMASETVTTIGQQRIGNYAVKAGSEDEFVRLVTEGQSSPPGYFAHDVAFNKGSHASLGDVMARSARSLSLGELEGAVAEGAVLLDVRDPDAFAEGHLPGAINVGLDGRFAEWVGTMFPPGTRFVVVAESGAAEEAIMRLGRIGYDDVVGFLRREGTDELPADGLLEVGRNEPSALAGEADGGDVVIVDVRGPGERESDHIEGSMHVPLPELPKRLADVPRDRRVVVHCAGGYRSMIAASWLQRAGFAEVEDLRGGLAAWREAFPLATQ